MHIEKVFDGQLHVARVVRAASDTNQLDTIEGRNPESKSLNFCSQLPEKVSDLSVLLVRIEIRCHQLFRFIYACPLTNSIAAIVAEDNRTLSFPFMKRLKCSN